MSPISKAHTVAFTLATAVAYSAWNYVATIQTEYEIVKFCITLLLSLSFYRAIFKVILLLCKNMRIFRKAILGRYYFEGLWIGYLVINDEVEYYYEIVEQDLEHLTVRGKSFNQIHTFAGEWTIIDPNLNITDAKLTYYYEMNDASLNGLTLGYSRATVFWDKRGHAYKEVGFAMDCYSSGKQQYFSVKIENPQNVETWIKQNFWNEVNKLYSSQI